MCGGVDFRSISVEKIMFSLEPGWGGGGRFLVDFSIFGFRTPFRFFVCSFVCSFVRSVVFSFLRLLPEKNKSAESRAPIFEIRT